MPMHAAFARPGVRKWIARNKPRSHVDSMVFVVALVLLAFFAGGVL